MALSNAPCQVGGQLFRVPRYCFLNEAGATFHKLFSHPFGKFDIVKGSSIRHPLPLPKDVSAFDFENFLKVMYPLYVVLLVYLSLLSTLPSPDTARCRSRWAE